MLFSFSANGTPTGCIIEQVYQGSVKANKIYAIFPCNGLNVVSVSFKRADNTLTQPYFMNCAIESIDGIVDDLNNKVGVWECYIPEEITSIAGEVEVQFSLTEGDGTIICTAVNGFTVQEGVVASEPVQGDTYQDVLVGIAQVGGVVSGLSANKLDKNFDKNVVYATDSEGMQNVKPYSSESEPDSIAVRDENGNLKSAYPAREDDVATKNYVDNFINDTNHNLTNVTETLSGTSHMVGLLNSKVQENSSILKGCNKSVAYADYLQAINTISSYDKTQFNVGQNVYIERLNVPDMWIAGVYEDKVEYNYVSEEDTAKELTENGSIRVGHYKLCALEVQQVNLTEYFKKTDVQTSENQDGSINLIINAF